MFMFSALLIPVTEAPKNTKEVDLAAAFEAYCDMVYRLAFIRTGKVADAEDILSEVFLRLVKNKNKIDGDEHLKNWLIRVTINCSNTLFKRLKRRGEVELTENCGFDVIKEDMVLPAVLSLPENQKIIVYMYYYEGYSVEEIAGILGIPSGTVKSRLARARDKLKIKLSNEF